MLETSEDVSFEMDEDLQATESRIKELRKKAEKSPEEEKEFLDLKKHHRGRLQEQLQEKEESRVREAERAARAEQALLDAQQRLKEIQESRERSSAPVGDDEYEVINGKKFYTDDALESLVASGKMKQKDAWKLQKAAIEERAVERFRKENTTSDVDRVRRDTMDEVMREYPEFLDARHPKHNPNDPLYKEANRLWTNGYSSNPRGMKLAIEDAKKNLGVGIKRPDLSDELSVSKNNAATDSSSVKSKTVELNEIEKDNAVRYWVGGQVTNPKTGRAYTQTEAIQKAMDAKKRRLETKKG